MGATQVTVWLLTGSSYEKAPALHRWGLVCVVLNHLPRRARGLGALGGIVEQSGEHSLAAGHPYGSHLAGRQSPVFERIVGGAMVEPNGLTYRRGAPENVVAHERRLLLLCADYSHSAALFGTCNKRPKITPPCREYV